MLRVATQISDSFMEQFVETTSLWGGEEGVTGAAEAEDPLWLDDRHVPAYVRADAAASARGAEFDAVLQKALPTAFAKRARLGGDDAQLGVAEE